MIDPKILETKFIRPALKHIAQFDDRLYNEVIIDLLMGTAAQESNLGTYLTQIHGPAITVFQIEPQTHESIWQHYLSKPSKRKLSRLMADLAPQESVKWADGIVGGVVIAIEPWALYDMRYASAFARLVYWPKTEPLPAKGDIEGYAKYWDRHYNANPDKGFPSEFINKWKMYLSDWKSDATTG